MASLCEPTRAGRWGARARAVLEGCYGCHLPSNENRAAGCLIFEQRKQGYSKQVNFS